MKILNILEDSINMRFIAEAVRALRQGELIVYPTDTIYAIGCDALNNIAIERICAIKGIKPEKSHLSIICDNISQVSKYAKCNDAQFMLLKRNTPGPFTFLLPALSKLPKAFKGRKIVGIRIPSNKIATTLVEELGHPILSTSVDGRDDDYMCEPEFIAQTYATQVSLVIDGGRGSLQPSTIIDCTGSEPTITRQGKGSLA